MLKYFVMEGFTYYNMYNKQKS